MNTTHTPASDELEKRQTGQLESENGKVESIDASSVTVTLQSKNGRIDTEQINKLTAGMSLIELQQLSVSMMERLLIEPENVKATDLLTDVHRELASISRNKANNEKTK